MAPKLQAGAIILGLVLGLVLPFFGMVRKKKEKGKSQALKITPFFLFCLQLLPIRRALSHTLREALNVYHNMTFTSIIKVGTEEGSLLIYSKLLILLSFFSPLFWNGTIFSQ